MKTSNQIIITLSDDGGDVYRRTVELNGQIVYDCTSTGELVDYDDFIHRFVNLVINGFPLAEKPD